MVYEIVYCVFGGVLYVGMGGEVFVKIVEIFKVVVD